jgi:hypothetical protein
MTWFAAQPWPVLPPRPLWPWMEAAQQQNRKLAAAGAAVVAGN